jgi:hypothetical protein
MDKLQVVATVLAGLFQVWVALLQSPLDMATPHGPTLKQAATRILRIG